MKKASYIIAAIVFCTLAVVFYHYNPAKTSFFPRCPFHTITHLYCPGCGTQRAIYCLLHGDFLKAVQYNALMVASLPLLFIHFGYRTVGFFRNENLQWQFLHNPMTSKALFVIVVAFTIFRNLYLHMPVA